MDQNYVPNCFGRFLQFINTINMGFNTIDTMDKYNNNNTIISISVKCAGTGGAGLTQRFWNYFRKPDRKVAGSPVVMLVTPGKKTHPENLKN